MAYDGLHKSSLNEQGPSTLGIAISQKSNPWTSILSAATHMISSKRLLQWVSIITERAYP